MSIISCKVTVFSSISGFIFIKDFTPTIFIPYILSEESPHIVLTTLTLFGGMLTPFSGTLSPSLNNWFNEITCTDTFFFISCSKSLSDVSTIISSLVAFSQ